MAAALNKFHEETLSGVFPGTEHSYNSKIEGYSFNVKLLMERFKEVPRMPMKNMLMEKFRAGQKTIGGITHLKSSAAIEALGYAGADYVMIDMEHSSVGIDFAAEYILAAQLAGLTPVVRTNGLERNSILNLLDAGAQGLIVPCIETADEVRQIIRYAKFAPLGERGYCMTRNAGWRFAKDALGTLEEYMAYCNSQTLLLPLCETVGCLNNIEEIVALEGVDGIHIGPFDLSISMGKVGQFDDPEFKAALAHVREVCNKYGKIASIYTSSAVAAKQFFSEGFDSIMLGIDAIILIEAYQSRFAEALG